MIIETKRNERKEEYRMYINIFIIFCWFSFKICPKNCLRIKDFCIFHWKSENTHNLKGKCPSVVGKFKVIDILICLKSFACSNSKVEKKETENTKIFLLLLFNKSYTFQKIIHFIFILSYLTWFLFLCLNLIWFK